MPSIVDWESQHPGAAASPRRTPYSRSDGMPEGAGESGNGRSMSEQSSADLSRGLSEHSQSSRGGSSTARLAEIADQVAAIVLT